MLLVIAGVAAFAGTPAVAGPPGHQPGEEASVLRAMDRYMKAISEQDLAAMAAMQLPDGMTYRARHDARGGSEIVGRPNTYWIDPAHRSGQTHRERYWSPTVLIRGDLAVVWAPYEFWVDGKTSHCGVDVFSFARVDAEWRVANSMWTVESDACPELRPTDATVIRPAD
jgi:Putative lumazine-binding